MKLYHNVDTSFSIDTINDKTFGCKMEQNGHVIIVILKYDVRNVNKRYALYDQVLK